LKEEIDEKMNQLEKTILELTKIDSGSDLSESEELFMKMKKKQKV